MAKDKWDKADIIVKMIATLMVPVILAAIGIYLNFILKEKEELRKNKELSLKSVEIAIGVLNSQPTVANQPLRDWAINIINKNADVKLTPTVIKLLKEKPLPKHNSIYQENIRTIIESDTSLKDEKGNLLIDEKGVPLTFK